MTILDKYQTASEYFISDFRRYQQQMHAILNHGFEITFFDQILVVLNSAPLVRTITYHDLIQRPQILLAGLCFEHIPVSTI